MSIRDLIPWKKQRGDVAVRYGGGDPWLDLHRQVDAVFDDMFRNFGLAHFGGASRNLDVALNGFGPRIDVVETADEVTLTAELPGLDERDIDISVDRGSVTIRGEKKEEHEEKDREYYRMERSFGSFSRTISVPVEVDPDKAKARYNKGVLTLSLPKTEVARKAARRIPVTAG